MATTTSNNNPPPQEHGSKPPTVEELTGSSAINHASDTLLFTMHVSNLLFGLLVDTIVDEDSAGRPIPRSPLVAVPTIRRFRGALAFLDISGFTALSQRMDVESLKNTINAYFSKMISVVDEYGGDVLKFAGDALFIAWPTGSSSTLLQCVQKAVAAAMRVTELCNNYEVRLTPPHGGGGGGGPHRGSTGGAAGAAAVTYLNVHAGVTHGVMAACDVGVDCVDDDDDTAASGRGGTHYSFSRWETLVLGSPLASVAICEANASSGEVVVCSGVHRLLAAHEAGCAQPASSAGADDTDTGRQPLADDEEQLGNIVFQRREQGTYRVRVVDAKYRKEHDTALIAHTKTLYSTDAVASGGGIYEEDLTRISPEVVEDFKTNPKMCFLFSMITLVHENWELSRQQHLAVKRRIMDSVKGHVHEAARESMVVDVTSVRAHADKTAEDKQEMASLAKLAGGSKGGSNQSNVVMQAMMVGGELRKVCTLFINVKVDVELYEAPPATEDPETATDEKGDTPSPDENAPPAPKNDRQQLMDKIVPFIHTTPAETGADAALLQRLQSVMEILTSSLYEQGGQLRQFIHDDKGTGAVHVWVCFPSLCSLSQTLLSPPLSLPALSPRSPRSLSLCQWASGPSACGDRPPTTTPPPPSRPPASSYGACR